MAFQLAQAFIDIKARTANLQQQVNNLRSQLSSQMRSLGQGQAIGGLIAPLIGLQAAYSAVMSTGARFLAFDKNMTNALSIQANVAADTQAAMKALAVSLAVDTGQAAADVAEGFYFLASAGLDAEQQIKALPIAANFATAGLLDMGRATSILNDAQKAAGMASQDAQQNMLGMQRVADVITKASILSNASIGELGEALARAGASVGTFGASFEETAAVLAAFADIGKKAGAGGTAGLIVLRDLQTAATKNASALRANNVEVFDATGRFVGMARVLAALEQRMAGLSDEARRGFLRDVVGLTDRSLQFTASLLGSSGKIKDFTEQLERAGGTAKEVADKQMDSLSKQLSKVGNQFLGLALNGLDPFVRAAVAALQPVGMIAQALGKLVGAMQGMPAKLIAVAAGFAALANAQKIGGFLKTAVLTTPWLGKFARALGFADVAASSFGQTGARLSLVFSGMLKVFKLLSSITAPVTDFFEAIAKALDSIPLIGGALALIPRAFAFISKAVGVGFASLVTVQFGKVIAGIVRELRGSALIHAFTRNAAKIGEVFEQVGRVVVKVIDSITTAIIQGIAGMLRWTGIVDGFGTGIVETVGRIAEFAAGVFKVMADNWQSTWDVMREAVNVVVFKIRQMVLELSAMIQREIANVLFQASAAMKASPFTRGEGALLGSAAEAIQKSSFETGVSAIRAAERLESSTQNLGKQWEKLGQAMKKELLGRRGFGPEGRAMVNPRTALATAQQAASNAMLGQKLQLPSFVGLEDLQKQIQEALNKEDGDGDKLNQISGGIQELKGVMQENVKATFSLAENQRRSLPEGVAGVAPPVPMARPQAAMRVPRREGMQQGPPRRAPRGG